MQVFLFFIYRFNMNRFTKRPHVTPGSSQYSKFLSLLTIRNLISSQHDSQAKHATPTIAKQKTPHRSWCFLSPTMKIINPVDTMVSPTMEMYHEFNPLYYINTLLPPYTPPCPIFSRFPQFL